MFLYLKNGINETGIRILFVKRIRRRIFLTLRGRYQKRVGAVKMMISPYNGMNSG
jgi:hypothetical protein